MFYGIFLSIIIYLHPYNTNDLYIIMLFQVVIPSQL